MVEATILRQWQLLYIIFVLRSDHECEGPIRLRQDVEEIHCLTKVGLDYVNSNLVKAIT